MVKRYLEDTKEKLIEQKLEIQSKYQSVLIRLKENMEFIRMLEESSDPTYEAFTPREVNGQNKKKLQEMQEEQRLINEELDALQEALVEVDYKIGEIDSVIKVARKTMYSDSSSQFRLAVLETQEHERQRIARDLHDSTVQTLTSLVHKSELCMKLIEMDPARCKLEISSMSKILRSVIEDLREMIYDLRPMSFDDIGFDVTVERYLDRMNHSFPVKFQMSTEGEIYPLQSVVELSLLRVIQEACNNAVKHANPSNVKILLRFQEEQLELIIEDDGKGFDLSTIPEDVRSDNSGFGLSMMKERIFLLSGTITFESSVGNGFKILIQIPK